MHSTARVLTKSSFLSIIKNEPTGEALGLAKVGLGLNGIHASAGPVEACKERMVWLGSAEAVRDPFGALAIEAGVSPAVLAQCLANETVSLGGKAGPAFDLTEDADTADVLNAMAELSAQL